MLRKSLREVLLVLGCSLLLTLAAVWGLDRFLDYQISHLPYNPAVVHPYINNDRDKGLAFMRRSAAHGDIFLLGSSELEIHVPQHPKYFFPNAQAPWQVYPSGRAYAQSLQEAIRLGALPAATMRGQKVVLITSLQWFSSPEIIKAGQQARFSELQYYHTLDNPDLSKTTKTYIEKRMQGFLTGNNLFKQAVLYTRLSLSEQPQDKFLLTLMTPYYTGLKFYLALRDKWNTYKLIKGQPPYTPAPPRQVNWPREYARAAEEGKLSCTNNKFYVENAYYDRWLKQNIDYVKGKSDKVELLTGKEWEDLDCLLRLCRENQVSLYVVIMSTNGYYYDYTGMSKATRAAFYDKLTGVLRKNNVPYLNLQDKEYEPYFYYDVMHLGWKGWLYVDEQLTRHYGQAQ